MQSIKKRDCHKIKLSNLSRKPPCPGINSDESFTPEYLFSIDSNKSPICENIPPMTPIIIASKNEIHSGKNSRYINAAITDTTNPAMLPSHVFRGLISETLCLPNFFPKKYADVSHDQTIMKINNTGLKSYIFINSNVRTKGKVIYSKPEIDTNKLTGFRFL